MKNIIFLLIIFPSIVAFSQPRPMTTDDGLDMVGLSGSYLSPDGSFVLYGKSELNWKKNKRETTYHFVDNQGINTYQYIGKAGASSIQFSNDGKYVSFKRAVEKKQQLFIMRTAGGEAIQLSEEKTSIGSYMWSKDNSKIFFISSNERTKEEQQKYKDGFDHIVIDEGPNGQQEGKWNSLYVLDVESKKSTKLTKGELRIGGFDISPDGMRILYTARFENRRNQGNLSEIFMLDLKDSSTVQLTDNKVSESRLVWSPDGKSFVYSAVDDKTWELKNAKIWLMDPATKSHKLISGKFIGSIRSQYFWTPDSKSLIFSGLQGVNTNIFKLNIASGELSNLTNQENGTYSLVDMSADRTKMIYSYTDYQTPRNLYHSEVTNFKPTQLTDLNPGFKDKYILAKAETISWESTDGLEIEGVLYLPNGHSSKGKSQFLLHIHGGPAGVFTDAFSYRYHVWAGLGYVQLAPNVRGSSGYSDDLLRGNMNDIGGEDYQDLMTGVDYLIKKKYIDKNKMAVRGWSYGGILGGTTITKTDRFKAASLGAMVSDWTSEYGIGFNYDIRLWYIGGTPWENPMAYREKSPLTHVSKVTTPTLLLHGGSDRTDTEAQSLMFFTALKDQGKTVRYIRFPREPHGFREPRHQRTRDIEEILWIQKYTLGLDWKPWERAEDKKKDEAESQK